LILASRAVVRSVVRGIHRSILKSYRLLADAMAKSGRVAIAELVSRGKEQLVLIRPYRKGLVLHTMYYGDEVRDFNQVPKGNDVKISEEELELGIGLDRPAHDSRLRSDHGK
jgi:DNA end-binding protein Ku